MKAANTLVHKSVGIRTVNHIKNCLLEGYIKSGRHKLPKVLVTGLVGVVLMYIGTAGMVSVVTPWWLGRGDAPRHIDYAYSIYKGDIPQFNDPLRYPKFNELARGNYRNQPAAVNPPLFYIIHAPFVGPLMESGNWKEAIAVGRALNILFGIICILVLAWGGWIFGGKRKELLAIAVPALGALTFNFTALNQNYALDVLLVIFTTVSLILSHTIIQKGVTRKYVILTTILAFAGMATKATYIVFLFTNLLAIIFAFLIHGKGTITKRAIRGTLVSGGIFLFVVFTIGWYYFLQNFIHSGNWVSAAPEGFGSAHRKYKTLGYVLTSSELWGFFYEKISATKTSSLLITTMAVAGIASAIDKYKVNLRLIAKVKADILLSAGLMLVATAGIFATQIFHAVGYGGFYFRYLLPVLLPIGLVLAYGLLEFRWVRGQLVAIAALVMSLTTIEVIVKGSAIKEIVPGIEHAASVERMIKLAAEHNGFSVLMPIMLYACIGMGAAILGVSLHLLSATRTSANK